MHEHKKTKRPTPARPSLPPTAQQACERATDEVRRLREANAVSGALARSCRAALGAALLLVTACSSTPTEPPSSRPSGASEVALYKVVPRPCDSGCARALATTMGIARTAIHEDDVTFQLTEGTRTLIVQKPTGTFTYNDLQMDDPGYPATTLTEQEAIDLASTFLDDRGLLPAGALLSGAALAATKDEPPVARHWTVSFAFELPAGDGDPSDSRRLAGVGIAVTVGDSEVLGLDWSFRDLVFDRNVPLRDASTIEGLDHAELIYQVSADQGPDTYAIPYWYGTGGEDAQTGGHGHADAQTVRATDAVPDVTIAASAPDADGAVELTASVKGGAPPYSFTWRDTREPDGTPPLSVEDVAALVPAPGSKARVVVVDATGLSAVAELSLASATAPPLDVPALGFIGGGAGPVSSGAKVIVNADWSIVADTAGSDGLVLTSVKTRVADDKAKQKVASRISMPSYGLSTGLFGEQTCKLSPSAPAGQNCASQIALDTTCWGSGATINGKPCLPKNDPDNPIILGGITNPYRSIDPDSLVVQAVYAVTNVAQNDACTLWVYQTYVFPKPAAWCADAPQITDETGKCARFYPLLTYALYDSANGWCDKPQPKGGYVLAFEPRYRFDYDLAADGKDVGLFVHDTIVGGVLADLKGAELRETSALMVGFGAPGASLGTQGTFDNLHTKNPSANFFWSGVAVPTCDLFNPAVNCAHMHWNWPFGGGAAGTDPFRKGLAWAPGSQSVMSHLVSYQAAELFATDPASLVGATLLKNVSSGGGVDNVVWVVSRSEAIGRGKNLWGHGNSGWSDQFNNNEWFFQ